MRYVQKLWIFTLWLALLFMSLLGVEHFYSRAVDPSFDLCLIRQGWGCREVINHPFSRFALLPIAIWGIAVYAIGLMLGPVTWHRKSCRLITVFLVIFLCAASAFFLFIMRRDLVDLCPLCLGSHICHLLLLILLIAGLSKMPSLSDVESLPLKKLLFAPLMILLAGYMITSWTVQRTGESRLARNATKGSLIASVLNEDFSRYFPAHNYQLIAGDVQSSRTFTIIGSLACRHCRDLVASIKKLPDTIRQEIGIFFVPYPIAPSCNPRVTGQDELNRERCVLAEGTLLAQKEGLFWPWFEKIHDAPGAMLRSLRQASPAEHNWSTALSAQIEAANEIPVDSIPLLIWDGLTLGSAGSTVPLLELLSYLMETQKKRTSSTPVDDCIDC
jgi:uncharacterized membrane protein